MKVKYFWILLVTVLFIGCDDNTGDMGLEMLPGSDLLEVKSKKYNIRTQSILSDSVFAKVNTGYIGKFTDPEFGFYEASFLTELNCTENFRFPPAYDGQMDVTNLPEVMAGDSIYDVYFQFVYGNQRYFGDSLNACRISLYELDKPLEKKYYTSIDPKDYYNPNKEPLVRKAYTAVDQSMSDSLRKANRYINFINFDMPKEFGENILRLNRDHPELFDDAESFKQVFKGLYAKADYGDGTILYIDQISLVVRYCVHARDRETGELLKKKDGTDSIGYSRRAFVSTKEIIQANSFTNSEKLVDKVNEQDWTYIKSPAGIFTQATLPIEQIYTDLHNDTLNSVKLAFTGYVQRENNIDDVFALKAPTRVLLLREKDAYTFFEKNSLPDDNTSYLSTLNANNEYTFSNITNLVNYCIAEKEAVKKEEGKDWTAHQWKVWEEKTKWNNVVLVPVVVNYQSANNSNILNVQNDMRPGYIKLKGGDTVNNSEEPLQITVEYTEFY